MPRRADIINPLGTGAGRDFLVGYQERNKQNLLEVLHAAEPVIAEIAKVKPQTWKSMKGIFSSMERGMSAGIR